ncbi:LolA family protein [Profundibacter amoris]|uniref:Outer membrane lipoprotein carrier protein LolA n=1 Tax=Profundibacter amoris TaxID=2171755 RepID=A0A347UJP6_9RHOB|nr:outer membrane lipoprotein carrier protein LolA [Profundibacter amoris]AXX99074.1 outer membrane lipoprotein carrier protein LolA [Profundibacter amoris]
MKHLRLLILPILWVALSLPVAAEKLSLNQISNYLNKFTTAKGGFTQINGDGTISTGTIYIRRPGRIRFEYAPPDKTLVLASAGTVAIFDSKSNTAPEQYPLKRTPLGIILQKNVNLARAKMVVGHTSDGKTTTVVAQDPEHPDYGQIRLLFTSNPIELRQWVIVDGTGGETTLVLNELGKGMKLPARLFNIDLEAEDRGF